MLNIDIFRKLKYNTNIPTRLAEISLLWLIEKSMKNTSVFRIIFRAVDTTKRIRQNKIKI